jgi:hypothetical protein
VAVAPFMTCGTVLEVMPPYVLLPEYTAVIGCVPPRAWDCRLRSR